MKRTFIALPVSPSAEWTLLVEKIRHQLQKQKIKWVKQELLHLTLAFLGDTNEELINEISRALTGIAPHHHAFTLSFRGMGLFPDKALWIGIENNTALNQLAEHVHETISHFGFQHPQMFSPHITIGRPKEKGLTPVITHALAPYQNHLIHRQEITQFSFYESILSREGPEYRPIASYALTEKST